MRVRLVVLISLLVVSCKSQNAQTPFGRSAVAADSTMFLVTPFDSARSSLGPNFKGHSVASVFKAIDQSPARKDRGEFETTAAFERRRSSFGMVPLFGHVLPTSTLAFVVTVGSDDPDSSTLSYDPDSESLDVYLPAPRDNNSSRRIVLKKMHFDDGTYIAQNAFNAKARVKSFHVEDYGVHFKINGFVDEPTYDSNHPLVTLSIPLNEAKKIKPSLRVLVVCRLVDPWIDTDNSFHEATITEPDEWTIYYENLNAVILSYWVFDQRTGKVFEKVSAGSKPFPDECLHRDGSEGMQACLDRVAKQRP